MSGHANQQSSADLAAKLSKLKQLSDADKQLIATLQAKLEEQKRELDNRTVTIGAIQRNFENLSTVAAAERAELDPASEVVYSEEEEWAAEPDLL